MTMNYPWEDTESDTNPTPETEAALTIPDPTSEPIPAPEPTSEPPLQTLSAASPAAEILPPPAAPAAPPAAPEPSPIPAPTSPPASPTTVVSHTPESPSPTPSAPPQTTPPTMPTDGGNPAAPEFLQLQIASLLHHNQMQAEQARNALQAIERQAQNSIQSVSTELQKARDEIRELTSTLSTKILEFEARQEAVNTAANMTLDRIRNDMTQVTDTLSTSAKSASSLSTELVQTLKEHTPKLEGISRTIKKRIWIGSILFSTGLFLLSALLLTWLRPGWMLTPEQHQALYVGAATIRDYNALSPADQAQVRKLLRWKDPINHP